MLLTEVIDFAKSNKLKLNIELGLQGMKQNLKKK